MRVLDRAVQGISANELAILLLTGPLFLFMGSRPVWAPVLLLLPLLWAARYIRGRHWIPRTPVDWPILGLMTMALISLLVSPDQVASLNKVVGLAYAIALFYALTEWGQVRAPSQTALVVVGLGAGIAFLSLLGTQWSIKWSLLEGITPHLPRLVGRLPGAESGFNPNTVSGTLVLVIPVQLCLLWSAIRRNTPQSKRRTVPEPGRVPKARNRRRAWIAGLSLVPTVGVVVLAQSRAAWVALLLGLIGLAGIATRRLRLLGIVCALALVVTLAVFALVGPVEANNWLVRQGWMTGSAEKSWAIRAEIWSRGLWSLAENPLTGMGMDIFRSQSAVEPVPLLNKPARPDIGHAHNLFLQVALDLGIPGLISYLALFGGTVAAGWRLWRWSPDRSAGLVALGCVVGLGTHTVWSLVDALPLGARTNFVWWLVAGLVMAAALRGKQQAAGPEFS